MEALLENQLDAPGFGRAPKLSLRTFHYHVLSRVREINVEEKKEEEDDEEESFTSFWKEPKERAGGRALFSSKEKDERNGFGNVGDDEGEI